MLIVACGTAAPPEPANDPTPEVVEGSVEATKSFEKEIPKEIIKNVVVTPTPLPAQSSEAVEAKESG